VSVCVCMRARMEIYYTYIYIYILCLLEREREWKADAIRELGLFVNYYYCVEEITIISYYFFPHNIY
jgi:hypothetical protein